MQVKAGVQAPPASMLDQILCRLECPQVLVALPDRLVLAAAAIVAIGHQDGDLSAQLRQFERACDMSAASHEY